MRRFLQIIALCLTAVLIFYSCDKENIKPEDVEFASDKEYFPLKTGKSLIYKITAITINKPSNYFDTAVYYLKERTDIPFVDNEGDTAYRIERYTSPTMNNWKISDIWEAKITEKTAEKVEENRRIIKMKFPLSEGMQWNANIKNEQNELYSTITSLSNRYSANNQNFDSCISINWNNEDSIVNLQSKCEKYARGIGLVYKDSLNIYSDEIIIGLPIINRVTSGTIYYQELVSVEE